jgi:ferrous iron transport protein A
MACTTKSPFGVIGRSAESNLNAIDSHLDLDFSRSVCGKSSSCSPIFQDLPMLLSDLANGASATVTGLSSASAEVGGATLRRLGELGFIPGEPVQLLRRGPGGREPLAVRVGETLFALRLVEARCIEVKPS